MKLNLYTIYDSKSHAYHQPMFFINEAVALRAFTQACNDPASFLNQSPSDYSLFHLGVWDDDNATIEMLNAPHCLGLASTFKKETE